MTFLPMPLPSALIFAPAGIIEDLDLLRPIYAKTAAYGHFGRPIFPWEQTDRVARLQEILQ